MSKQTAVDWFYDKIKRHFIHDGDLFESLTMVSSIAKEKEQKQMIDFHKWMKENDTAENAEKFFHYSDEDMFNEYLRQVK